MPRGGILLTIGTSTKGDSMAKTVKALLDQARNFHGQLREFYAQCGSSSASERVKMLTNYMEGREDALEKAIADYESNAAKRILETSLKFTPGDEITSCFDDLKITPGMTVDDVLRLGLKLDEALVRFYRQIAEDAACEDVRDLFSHLMAQEEREKRQTVRSAMELEQL
jgi:bacterioferritin (cytochrome b1)